MLEISNIDVCYGDLQALWKVSLKVNDGEIVTLVGSNGAGKSTILKTISGLLKPKAGSITYGNISLNKLSVHRIVETGISMVPEGRKIWSEMSVLENLEMGAFNSRARPKKNETLNSIYEVFPILQKREGQAAGTLSGGEQQMLAIGRALMALPKLLLIDEMSLGLAPLLVLEFSRVVEKLNEFKGITIFLVEQNVLTALKLADRGYIVENGRIVDEGRAADLLNSDSVKAAYLGLDLAGEAGEATAQS